MENQKPNTPRWCDLSCPHADWPEETDLDGAGSCRTFVALHCSLHNRVVAKNAPCLGPLKEEPERKRRKQ